MESSIFVDIVHSQSSRTYDKSQSIV